MTDEQVDGQSMLDSAEPIRIRKGQTLVFRYRYKRDFGKFTDDVLQSRQIETTMHGREEWHARATKKRQSKPVDVRVDDVEFGRAFRDRFQQYGVGRIGIRSLSPEAQRLRPNAMKLAPRPEVPAGEQRDVVAQFDQFVY